MIHNALGTHRTLSRVQGRELKAKHKEIRVASLFKEVPIEWLRMIVVPQVAMKERLLRALRAAVEPDYHQHEFDLQLYLDTPRQQRQLWTPSV